MAGLSFKDLISKKKKETTKAKFQLADEQLVALEKMEEFLDSKDPVLVLQGYAGTGKTAILNEYIQYLDSIDANFTLCAPTHKAKLLMEDITGYDAITVHKLLALSPNIEIFELDYRDLKFRIKGLGEIPNEGIVIIDEASMINDEIYKLLIEMCATCNTKLLFIGDIAQLQGVGNLYTSRVFNCPNIITLTKIHRQADTNGLLPLLAKLRERPAPKFKSIEAPEGSLFVFNDAKEFMNRGIEFIRKSVKEQNVTGTKIIAYTNARVQGFNQCVRRMLWETDTQYHQYDFLTGYENFEFNGMQFYNSLDYIVVSPPKKVEKHIPHYMKLPGWELELYDTVYKTVLTVFILDSDLNSDYVNSLAAQIESVRISAVEAKKYGNRTKSSFLWKHYFEMIKSFGTPKDMVWDNRVIKKKTFDYGYSSTIHRVQGSSLDTVFVDMKNVMSCRNINELRQMQYVSLSRTKSDAYILT